MARRKSFLSKNSALRAGIKVTDLSKFFVLLFNRSDYTAAYCSVISRLRRTEMPGLGTMGVRNLPQGGAELVFDPMFNDMVKTPEFRETPGKILIHELVHLQENHTGRGLRLYQMENDPELWGRISPIAVDFACNSSCLKWNLFTEEALLSSLPLQKDPDGLPVMDDKGRPVSVFRGLHPSEYDLPMNLSYERYYKILKDIENDIPPPEWLDGDGGDEDGQGKGKSKREKNDSTNDQGDGSGGSSQEDGSELDKKMGKVKDLIERTSTEKKRYVHAEDLSDLSEDEIEDLIAAADANSQAAIQEISSELKSRGLGSTAIALELEDRLKEPMLNPAEIIKALVIQESLKVGKKKSIRSPNRRLTAMEKSGVCLFPGSVRDSRARVAFFVDTSGSVSSEEFDEGRAEFASLHSYLKEVKVVYCDSDITKVETLSADSSFPATRWGCGGTSFDPPFMWLQEQTDRFDLVIYLTDGGAPLPKPQFRPTIPVLWLITSRGHLPGSYYSTGSMLPGRMYGKLEGLEYGTAIKLLPKIS
jgi:hypothetical protein